MVLGAAVSSLSLFAAPLAGAAGPTAFSPGNLLVSKSTYPTTPPAIVAGTTALPPGCGAAGDPCATAVTDGTYPQVFNNASVDPAFGVTSPIVLDQLTTAGAPVNETVVPNSSTPGVTSSSDQLVTSFSSKSELGLNQSTDGRVVTFMGYDAPVAAVDISNSNTPGAVDSTNPVTGSDYRAIGQLDSSGTLTYTLTNAYSGNNGRAAALNSATGQYYTVGNAGNGANPEAQGVVTGAGAQIVTAVTTSESAQTPGSPTPLGNFNITQLGQKADKSAKDDNFRGLTVSNNVVYATKGSGSNGVNTVYFVDTSGSACPSGSGTPAANAALPTASVPAFSTSNTGLGLSTTNPGLAPTNMCILNGFPTALAKTSTTYFPFGVWFATPTTLYVADEGSGVATYNSSTNTYTAAAASTTAGLEKWILNTATNTWTLAYTLQSGLNLGTPYTVAGYPTGNNSGPGGTSQPWAPATDGLRNLSGHVNADGTVSLWAATSTVSGSGDQGTDPNQLVSITDNLSATTPPAGEAFSTTVPAANATVVRGVDYITPATTSAPPASLPEVPWLPLIPLSAAVVGAVALRRSTRRRREHS